MPEWRPIGRQYCQQSQESFLAPSYASWPSGRYYTLGNDFWGWESQWRTYTPGNIAIVLMACNSSINESSFRYGHRECRGERGLMNLKEFFLFLFQDGRPAGKKTSTDRCSSFWIWKYESENITSLAEDEGSSADKRGSFADGNGSSANDKPRKESY